MSISHHANKIGNEEYLPAAYILFRAMPGYVVNSISRTDRRGWSRSLLINRIGTRRHEARCHKITGFERTKASQFGKQAIHPLSRGGARLSVARTSTGLWFVERSPSRVSQATRDMLQMGGGKR